MTASLQSFPPAEVNRSRPAEGVWRSDRLGSLDEMDRLLEAVTAAMHDAAYPARDVFGVRLATEEAIVNAVRHGNSNDPDKYVSVRYRVNADCVLIEVTDQGPGFNPHEVADPLAQENLERPGGRGLLLMRAYLTWLRYNRRGNGVVLCKCRSPEPRSADF